MRIRAVKVVMLAILAALVTASVALAQSGGGASPFGSPDPNRPNGLTLNTDQVSPGYVLVPLVQSKDILLLSNDGRVVHTWPGQYYPSNSAYLLDNGDLLRTSSLDTPENTFGKNGQWGFTNGLIEEYTWDNQLVWSFKFADDTHIGHHDIQPMPNGHVLILAYERFTGDEALAAGRNPAVMPEDNEVWSEEVVEYDPATNAIVWEWHVWDHLIQDYDPNRANYGTVADHPEKIDINYHDPNLPLDVDWLHANAVTYNADLDQVMISTRTYSEIWIIDHNTTTEEAKGPAGDLQYRWGNPAAYGAGTEDDHQLYYQHDPEWIPDGYPGAGHITVFDNGGEQRPYSRAVEIVPPVDSDGRYVMTPGQPTGPAEPVWTYVGDPPESFYSALISSVQRLPDGNTLIDEGLNGRIFEVTPDGQKVWEYYLPPAAWSFRADRYNLPAFANFDLTQSVDFTGGVIWGKDCTDGSQPRLHEYLPQEQADMQTFTDTYGATAQDHWETEACADHGGIAGS